MLKYRPSTVSHGVCFLPEPSESLGAFDAGYFGAPVDMKQTTKRQSTLYYTVSYETHIVRSGIFPLFLNCLKKSGQMQRTDNHRLVDSQNVNKQKEGE